jgi:hypothetical protein
MSEEVKVAEAEMVISVDPQVTQVIVGDPAHQEISVQDNKLKRAKVPNEQRNASGKGGFAVHPENINRNGRPKSFDVLRSLAQQIAEECARDENGKIIELDGRAVTNAENTLRIMMNSPLRDKFLEIAYGKVPQPIDAKITTWQDEIVKAMVEKRITPEDVYNELGPAAQSLIESAGLRLIESGKAIDTDSAE